MKIIFLFTVYFIWTPLSLSILYNIHRCRHDITLGDAISGIFISIIPILNIAIVISGVLTYLEPYMKKIIFKKRN